MSISIPMIGTLETKGGFTMTTWGRLRGYMVDYADATYQSIKEAAGRWTTAMRQEPEAGKRGFGIEDFLAMSPMRDPFYAGGASDVAVAEREQRCRWVRREDERRPKQVEGQRDRHERLADAPKGDVEGEVQGDHDDIACDQEQVQVEQPQEPVALEQRKPTFNRSRRRPGKEDEHCERHDRDCEQGSHPTYSVERRPGGVCWFDRRDIEALRDGGLDSTTDVGMTMLLLLRDSRY
jgi:hypothetical protein